MANTSDMARGLLVGLVGSLAIHALVLAFAMWATNVPGVEFELRLPDNVEFGLADMGPVAPAPRSDAVPPAPPPTEPPPKPVPAQTDEATEASKPDAGGPGPQAPDAGVQASDAGQDGGVTDGGPRDAGRGDSGVDAGQPLASSVDAGGEASTAVVTDAGQPLLGAYAPEGAQLSLRLNMATIRTSVLASEVRDLLDVIPDWQMIVADSGIDPLVDLERLFVASPNLRRGSLVMAGQYVGTDDLPRRAVAALAKARGVPAAWRQEQGFDVATWANRDTTERVLALTGPQQFAITRREDLARVLLVARAMAQRQAAHTDAAVSDMAGLLAMGVGETLVFEADGAQQFVAGAVTHVPDHLRVAIEQQEDGSLIVHARGRFEPEQVEGALRYWSRLKDRLGRHPMVALLGFGLPLREATIEIQEPELVARGQLSPRKTHLLLGYLTDSLRPRPLRPQTPLPRPPASLAPANRP